MGSVLSPTGTPVLLSCSLTEGFRQTWRVTIPTFDQSVVFSHDLLVGVPLLNSIGIQVENRSARMSQLVFTATMEIQVTVWCVSINESSPSIQRAGNVVEVIIYGNGYNVVRIAL